MEHDNNNNNNNNNDNSNNDKVHPNGNGVHPPTGMISLDRKHSAVATTTAAAVVVVEQQDVSAKDTTTTTTSSNGNNGGDLLLNDNSHNSLSTLSLPSAIAGIHHNNHHHNHGSGTSLRGGGEEEGSVSSSRPTTPTNHQKHKTRRQARYEAKRQQYCQTNSNHNTAASPTTTTTTTTAPINGLVVSAAAAGRAVSPLTTADLNTTTPTTTPTGPRSKNSIAERAQAKMRAFAKARHTEEQQQQQQEGSIEFPPRSTENAARQPQQQLLPEDTSEIPQQVAFVLQQQQQQQKLSASASSPNMTATAANNVASAAAVATTPRASWSSASSYESRLARKIRSSTHHRDRQANNNINSIPEDHESFHNEEVVSVSSATPQNMVSVDTPLGREVLLEPTLDDMVNSDLGASSEIDFDGSRGHGAYSVGGGVEPDGRELLGALRRRGSIASHNTETTEMREAGDDVPEMPGAFQVQGRPVGDMPEWHQRNLHTSNNGASAAPLSYSSGRSGVRGGRPLARENSWLQRSHRFVQRILSTHSSTSSRNDELGTSSRNDGLVEANMVSEAEAVVYASDVVKDRSSRTKLLLRIAGCCAVLVIVGLTAGITSMLLERSNDDGTMEDLGNPRCRLPLGEQNAFDHCDCYGTAQGLELVESEISLYALITETFLEEGLINQTYERTSCALENQGLLSLANFLQLGYAEEQLTVMVHPQNEREVAVQNLGLLTMHQRFILLMLYFRMDAPRWTNNNGWLYRRDTCRWHGVGCGYFERIETIRLPSNNLSGEMLALICKMPFLRTLDLSRNNITGTIPEALADLSSLDNLDLTGNRLTGTIPSAFGKLTALNRLALTNNRLTGPIPTEIGNMKKLQELLVENNSLSGPIPSELGRMTNLRTINLNHNSLNGTVPIELMSLSAVQQLDLSVTGLTGTLPGLVVGSQRLTALVATGTQLQGAITNASCMDKDLSVLIIILDCENFSNEGLCPVVCSMDVEFVQGFFVGEHSSSLLN